MDRFLDIASLLQADGPMSMIHDLERITGTVLPTDPSFRAIERAEMDRLVDEARRHARAGAKDEFLLSLMQLLALPGNGHTRLIPNAAISVLPLRFATIGSDVRLLAAPPGVAGVIGSDLISVNGVPVSEIETAAESFLAGTSERKRVIGPILFDWPEALARLGAFSGSGPIEYRMRNAAGRISALLPDMADRVPGSLLYPRNEHGKTAASWSPTTYLETREFGHAGLLLVLPSFYDPGETRLANAVSEAAARIRSRPRSPLVIDVRGNTGVDFLRTMPLIDAISEGTEGRRVGVIVDKFTFSAAIVFVAILKHRLGARLELTGEDMGDGLTFFAEGGTLELSSGAAVRYSSALHDWAQGRVDDTTPAEIAGRLVPVGTLELDRRWIAGSDDTETRDRFCRDLLERLGS